MKDMKTLIAEIDNIQLNEASNKLQKLGNPSKDVIKKVAPTKSSVELTAEYKELQKQMNQLQKQITKAQHYERQQQLDSEAVGADLELAKLWRGHFDANYAWDSQENHGDPREAKKYAKETQKIYNTVKTKYGQDVADAMNKHSSDAYETIYYGRGPSKASLKKIRMKYKIADKIFDPDDEF